MSKKTVNITATFWRVVLLGIITLLYFGYSYLVLRPQAFKNISLIDDITNQVETSDYLKRCIYQKDCNNAFRRVFDMGSRRLRPAWWVIGALTHTGLGENPTTEHLFRVYGIGYLSVITLALICISMGTGGLFVVLASLIYFTNFSFAENIIRLGPNEPYSVLLLGIFSLLFLEKEKIISRLSISKKLYSVGLIFLLIITLFIKENTFVVIPAIFIYEVFRTRLRIRKMDWGLIIIPLLVWGMGMTWSYMGKKLARDLQDYPSYYVLSLPILISNGKAVINIISNSTMPFLKLMIPLFFLSWVLLKQKMASFDNRFWYWTAFLFFFTVVLFPWKYILDRYQLMAIWAIAIVSTYLLNILYENVLTILKLKSTNPYSKYVIQAVLLVILSNLFFRGFPLNLARSINYSRFFESFLYFEKEQVQAIKLFNGGGVCINAAYISENSEIFLSIPKALRYLYDITPNFYVLEKDKSKCKYLFSKTGVVLPTLSKEELSKMKPVKSSSYKIQQINPLLFRESFSRHPLKTLLDTDSSLGDSILLDWELREL